MTVSPHALPITIARLSCSSKHLVLPPAASSNSLSLSLQAPDRVRRHYKPHTLPPSTKDTKDNKKKDARLQHHTQELSALSTPVACRRAFVEIPSHCDNNIPSSSRLSGLAIQERRAREEEEERRRKEKKQSPGPHPYSHLPCEWVDFQRIGRFWKFLAKFSKIR